MNSTMKARGVVISLDPARGVPFYRQIIQQIEHAILGQRLLPGDRLPTIRALAIDLKINPNTIARAYGELEIRGIVTTQVGNGTFVSDQPPSEVDDERNLRISETLARFLRDMRDLGVERSEVIDLVKNFKEEA
ncbi:transcriptional regulator, GntR family [Sediminispirochaeta smaragdinae DSM 11293]|uniref:Transcriptional regulator, GntR family n=2 Tax=Sediminispirochaeta TaxID=1911556 RepID=E1R910_SEDSS|nr:transcriptional regulator, GntR family [Sediminispirochaeta smaragdinae DSM 11293]